MEQCLCRQGGDLLAFLPVYCNSVECWRNETNWVITLKEHLRLIYKGNLESRHLSLLISSASPLPIQGLLLGNNEIQLKLEEQHLLFHLGKLQLARLNTKFDTFLSVYITCSHFYSHPPVILTWLIFLLSLV